MLNEKKKGERREKEEMNRHTEVRAVSRGCRAKLDFPPTEINQLSHHWETDKTALFTFTTMAAALSYMEPSSESGFPWLHASSYRHSIQSEQQTTDRQLSQRSAEVVVYFEGSTCNN